MGPGTGYPQGSPSVKLLPPAKFHIFKFLECQRTAPPAGNLLWRRNLGGALHVYLDHMVSRSMTMTPKPKGKWCGRAKGSTARLSLLEAGKLSQGILLCFA